MLRSISSALSGLRAHTQKLAVTANNMANANTDGFKKGKVTFEEGPGVSVQARITQVESPGPLAQEPGGQGEELVEKSNVDLGEEMVSLILTKRGFEANLKIVQTEDELVGSLLDLKA